VQAAPMLPSASVAEPGVMAPKFSVTAETVQRVSLHMSLWCP